MDDFTSARTLILTELEGSLAAIDEAEVTAFIDALESARSVFFVGVGRVLLSLEAMAKRFYHLGIDTHVVGEITEPAITADDLLVVGSGSGESKVPVAIAQIAHRHGARVAHIGSNRESSLAPITSLMVRIPAQTKLRLDDEIRSEQVMSSLFEQSLLIFGDAVALLIVRRRALNLQALWERHANLE